MKGVENKLSPKSFDSQGNFSFGVKEYIDVPGLRYDPEIGILGFDVAVSLVRPGYRIMRRRRLTSPISSTHRISKDDAIVFVKDKFGAKIGEDE